MLLPNIFLNGFCDVEVGFLHEDETNELAYFCFFDSGLSMLTTVKGLVAELRDELSALPRLPSSTFDSLDYEVPEMVEPLYERLTNL